MLGEADEEEAGNMYKTNFISTYVAFWIENTFDHTIACTRVCGNHLCGPLSFTLS